MKYKGMTCSSGSPAFANLIANEDSFVAEQLRQAGAVCIGTTNTPPMMASGMHRGLYGRAESPYNPAYLTAAFSSGSSNGSATSTAASFAAFGLGSETVSSGRSPASNNALVAFTGSRDVISPRGVWPLYPTCDVIVPQTRTVEDMLQVLDILTAKDPRGHENFWAQQTYVSIKEVERPRSFLDLSQETANCLRGKRLAVPKMFINSPDPKAKPTFVSHEVLTLWQQTRTLLTSLGAEVIETDFPLVSNYEYDSLSGHTNNVTGFTPEWNSAERGELVAYLWDDFLRTNADPNHPTLASANGAQMFPRPANYIPDRYMEHKNFMDYEGLVRLAQRRGGKSIWAIDGIAQALPALEAQRKRDLEDWMALHGIDAVVFPANGDVGRADLEFNDDSARHALQNGVKYSNGNRAIRHMGVPTVSVSMGLLEGKGMPCNATFAGRHGQDWELVRFAKAFEQERFAGVGRPRPGVVPELRTDGVEEARREERKRSGYYDPPKLAAVEFVLDGSALRLYGETDGTEVRVFVNGGEVVATRNGPAWFVETEVEHYTPAKPLYGGYGVHVGKVNVIVLARGEGGVAAKTLSIDPASGNVVD